ncbi:CbtB domain-containing protein [Leptolyngbya ohadii]|uniref:CbtB domain-containing protein n=1 Tax=Leptolyngbya ohadii TaxID=1962290 RepID=UPI000B59A834|nr:CbtB-domain containing protein [Leptolyngbya ohadii]
MTTATQNSTQALLQRTAKLTLSVPVQCTLFLLLTATTLWTVYFSSYAPAHNALHETRHSTLGVGCH